MRCRAGLLDPPRYTSNRSHTELECPGGGKYAAPRKGQPLESTVFGRPADPRETDRKPDPIGLIRDLRAGATFEKNGLEFRAEIHRAAAKEPPKKDK